MKYAAKKIVWMLLTMVIVSFLAFLAFRIIPGDPTAKLLGEQATPERVEALRQELGGPYDVVVANIVADVIKALASTVRPLVKEGGIFLCSGIIDDRAEEVAQCLRDNGWTIAETRSSEGWFSYLCR